MIRKVKWSKKREKNWLNKDTNWNTWEARRILGPNSTQR